MKKLNMLLVFVIILSIMVLPASGYTDYKDTEIVFEEDENSLDILNYSTTPTQLYPFIYKGHVPRAFPDMDVENCVNGLLYVFDKNTDEVTQISMENVITFTATQDGIFYITSERVIKYSAFDREEISEIGTVQGAVTSLDYFDGILVYVEDGTKIVFVDAVTGNYDVQYAAEAIKSIYQFDHDKLIWRNGAGDPNYLNISTGESVALETELEVNRLIAPYISQRSAEVSLYTSRSLPTYSQNDVTFPLDEFPADELTFDPDEWYPSASSYFNTIDTEKSKCSHPSSCNSIRYGGHTQCFGFAIYAHDKYMHLYSDEKVGWDVTGDNPEGWATGDFFQCATVTTDEDGEYVVTVLDDYTLYNHFDDTKAFFQSLQPGSYVRYGKDGDEDPENGSHSVVIVSTDDEGVWVYECNVDNKCGVYYTYYRYDYLDDGRYDYIHNYVNHSFEASHECASVERHRVNCVNCDGYLLEEHHGGELQNITNAAVHALSFSCCSGTVAESHTGTVTKTYTNISTHRVSASCCTGTVNESHTNRSYIIYSTTQHQTNFGCCGGSVYQSHVFNSDKTCRFCSYVEGGFVIQPGKKPIIEETE